AGWRTFARFHSAHVCTIRLKETHCLHGPTRHYRLGMQKDRRSCCGRVEAELSPLPLNERASVGLRARDNSTTLTTIHGLETPTLIRFRNAASKFRSDGCDRISTLRMRPGTDYRPNRLSGAG